MKRNYSIVGLILLSFFVISLFTNILGAINQSVSESFSLTETMAGFLPFAFFIAYGVMSIPSGFLVEKYGEKRMLVLAFSLTLAGALGFASSPTFPVFLISLFIIGSGVAMIQVIINPLLRVSGGVENYAFTSVLGQLIFGSASFFSPLLYSYLVVNINKGAFNKPLIEMFSSLVPQSMSWVSVYWVFVVIALLMIIVMLVTKFPQVELDEDERIGTKESYLSLFKNRYVILFFLALFAYVGTEIGISYWMSKYLLTYHGFDNETVGANTIAYFWGLMTIGGIVGLFLLKILDSKIVLRVFTILAMICLLLALFGPERTSLYAFPISGFFLSVMYPIIISLALNSVKSHHGSFTGILMTGVIGGAVVQLLVGFISDIATLRLGMLFLLIPMGYILSISFWANPIISNKTVKLKDIL